MTDPRKFYRIAILQIWVEWLKATKGKCVCPVGIICGDFGYKDEEPVYQFNLYYSSIGCAL